MRCQSCRYRDEVANIRKRLYIREALDLPILNLRPSHLISLYPAIFSQLPIQTVLTSSFSFTLTVPMAPLALLIAALVAPLAFAVPTPGNTYGTGGSAPAGYDASVENFCQQGFALACCTTPVEAAAGAPDGTYSGCKLSLSSNFTSYGTAAKHFGLNRCSRHGGRANHLPIWLLPVQS